MEETRKFLRYITPGLVFAVETLVLLWIAVPNLPESALRHFDGDKGIGVVLALFLASGGAGYVFSTIHHYMYWHSKRYPAFEYSNNADSKNKKGSKGSEVNGPNKRLSERRSKWVHDTCSWHKRLETSQIVKGSHDRANSLADIAHSSGSAFVASIFSIIATCLILMRKTQLTWDSAAIFNCLGSLIVAIVLFTMHLRNYRNAVVINQEFVEQVLRDAVEEEKRK
jgi:hypothetical protein